MPFPPITPRYNTYRESKENLRRKAAEHNAMANRVVEYLNTLIANDPSETQQYLYFTIARDLRPTDEVRSAIAAAVITALRLAFARKSAERWRGTGASLAEFRLTLYE
jgi:hypothetical protein